MSSIATLIADMVRSGIDADIIGRTAEALASREPIIITDAHAERRREKDRERKHLRNSAESAESSSPPIPPPDRFPDLPLTPPLTPPSPPLPPACADQSPELMAEAWNAICGDVLPKTLELRTPRRNTLKRRFVDTFAGEFANWEEYCRRIRGSPMLTGENERGWRANIDWVLKPENVTKIQEGNYDATNNSRTINARNGDTHTAAHSRPSFASEGNRLAAKYTGLEEKARAGR